MKLNKEEKQKLFINAEKKVKRIKIFYLHLAFYSIGVAFILYNFYILEGPYTEIITGLNISILVLWSVVIIIQAWVVFKGRLLFKKNWEDQKIKKYLEEKDKQETTMWE